MTIVSQDKKEIINFDNVRKLRIINNNYEKEFLKKSAVAVFNDLIASQYNKKADDLYGFGIFAYFSDSDNTMLGQYETEERAKEVLQEIINEYRHSCEIINGDICSKLMFQRPMIYEMPEK